MLGSEYLKKYIANGSREAAEIGAKYMQPLTDKGNWEADLIKDYDIGLRYVWIYFWYSCSWRTLRLLYLRYGKGLNYLKELSLSQTLSSGLLVLLNPYY